MKKNFTLIELLVVIAIIGILAAMIGPALTKAQDRGRQADCKNNLKQNGVQVTAYYSDGSSNRLPALTGNVTIIGTKWETQFEFDSNQVECKAKIDAAANADYISGFGVGTATGDRWSKLQNSGSILLQDGFGHEIGETTAYLTGDGSVTSLKFTAAANKGKSTVDRDALTIK